jgi:hypothetical protein
MPADLQRAEEIVRAHPRLTDFVVRREGEELHLDKAGEAFVRLIPAGTGGWWRIEIFRNAEEWEIINFTGPIEECLEFLTEHPHFLFWER